MKSIFSITSRANSKVKDFCRRAKEPSERDFLLEGRLFVKDVPPESVKDLLLTDPEKDREIAGRVLAAGGNVYAVSPPVMEKICGTDSVQQTVAFLEKPEIKRPNRLILLDRLQDPGNAGTIIRSAVAFGFGVMFGMGSVDPFCQKTVRSSAGTVCGCYIERGDLKTEIARLKKDGFSVFSAEADRTAKNLPSVSFPETFAVVIGNESQGVSREISDLCLEKILIPISDRAESLNAAVAASIIMYTGRQG